MSVKKDLYKITREKRDELVKELKKLQEKDLIEITNRMEESRREDSDEDGSNLGVISVEKESINKQIKEIEDILENCEIIEDRSYCEPGRIGLGSSVKLKEGEKILDLRLVSSLEADPTKNHLSDKSPLGRKLLKAKMGDTVSIKVRGNTVTYEILEVC